MAVVEVACDAGGLALAEARLPLRQAKQQRDRRPRSLSFRVKPVAGPLAQHVLAQDDVQARCSSAGSRSLALGNPEERSPSIA